MPPLDHSQFEEGDEEEGDAEAYDSEAYEDEEWDAEQSDEAARLDGAVEGVVADDFYEELDDSVVDEYPEEDIDA
jgi:hypothetical protein